jgi:peroxiredoxin
VLAISVDPPDKSRAVVDKHKLGFPILADTEHTVITAYGVVHEGGGPRGTDIALPANFLIDRAGRIVWQHVSDMVQDRPDPAEVMQEVERLLSKPADVRPSATADYSSPSAL